MMTTEYEKAEREWAVGLTPEEMDLIIFRLKLSSPEDRELMHKILRYQDKAIAYLDVEANAHAFDGEDPDDHF